MVFVNNVIWWLKYPLEVDPCADGARHGKGWRQTCVGLGIWIFFKRLLRRIRGTLIRVPFTCSCCGASADNTISAHALAVDKLLQQHSTGCEQRAKHFADVI